MKQLLHTAGYIHGNSFPIKKFRIFFGERIKCTGITHYSGTAPLISSEKKVFNKLLFFLTSAAM